jgi:hypothetical protein
MASGVRRNVLLVRLLAMASLVAALLLRPPTLAALTEVAAWLVRPLTLPFAWQAHGEAERSGRVDEAFACAQRLLRLLPSWTDGYIAFAYRYALADDPAADVATATRRLTAATAWLEGARASTGRREHEILQALAFLPEVAVRQTPALAATLTARGGPAGIADSYLAELERRFPSPARREQRMFFAPQLAASLLHHGARAAAIDVLRTAIDKARTARDRELAAAWAERLGEVARHLEGDAVDLTAVRADARLAPLLPFLR